MKRQGKLALARKRVKNREKKVDRFTRDEEKYELVLNNLKQVIFQIDAVGFFIYLNRPWAEITGFSLSESMGNQFLDYVYPEDKGFKQQEFTSLLEREKDYCRFTIRYLTKNSGFRWGEIFALLTLDENDEIIGITGTLNDVHERILLEQELKKHREHLEELVVDRTKALNEVNKKLLYQATHDSLTNLPNRYFLEDSLQKIIDKAKNKNILSALLFIDLDNFKVINDTYGHSTGDEVLVQFSNIMSKHAEKKHMIVRLGGDEFAVVLNESTLERATQIAEAIRTGLEAKDFELSSGITINIYRQFRNRNDRRVCNPTKYIILC